MMKFIQYGPAPEAESMRLVDGPVPQAGAGEVLIENYFVGVNRPDVLQRAGSYPPPPDASPILGLEVAGRVAALGEGVSRWAIGDLVCALTPGGGYAGFSVAPEGHVLPVPAGMSLAQAAALPENWFTVWANVAGLGRLAAGEHLLVHGGSSGIGLAAIQLGRLLGARVSATAGSPQKCDACRAFGATLAINYREQDFVERIKAEGGADVVLDMVGGAYLQKNIAALRRDGRLVLIGFLQGARAEIDFSPVMLKRLSVTGSTMRARSVAEKTAIRDDLLKTIWPAFADGRLHVRVDAEFPLAAAADAHRLMESNNHIGKIVLRVR